MAAQKEVGTGDSLQQKRRKGEIYYVTPQNRHLADYSDHATIYMMSL
jgi:hypothetical protein